MKTSMKLRGLYYFLPIIMVGYGLYAANNVWIAMLGYHAFALLILLCNKQLFQFRRILIGGSAQKIFLWTLLAAISGAALYGLGDFLNISDSLQDGLTKMGLSGFGWLIFIVYYALVNPVIEEVYWRGFLGSESNNISWSDIGYAGYHPLVFLKFLAVPWGILEFILLVAVGWLWRSMVKKHGGLLIPYAMHFSADLSIAVAIWLLVKG